MKDINKGDKKVKFVSNLDGKPGDYEKALPKIGSGTKE